MKLITTLSAIALSLQASAQITLEHSYPHPLIKVAAVDGSGTKVYYSYEQDKKLLSIYGSNHALIKTSSPNLPSSTFVSEVYYLAKNLFDNDGDFEYLVNYRDTGAAAVSYASIITNDDGTALMTLPYAWPRGVEKVANGWKLILIRATGVQPTDSAYTEIYSLPGQWLGIPKPNDGNSGEVASTMYPNPMETAATIRYQLPDGTRQASLDIYNINGVLMRSYQVTNQFNDILVQRGELPAGNYFYRINAAGVEMPAKQFAVH